MCKDSALQTKTKAKANEKKSIRLDENDFFHSKHEKLQV